MSAAHRPLPRLSQSIPWKGTMLLLCLLFLSCSETDEEAAVRALIHNAANRAQTHDLAGILELVTSDFQGTPGGWDRNGMKGILWRAFRYYGDFEVVYPRPRVVVESNLLNARATVFFLVLKGDRSVPGLQELYHRPGEWLKAVGKSGDLYRLRLKLVTEAGSWRCARAHLDRFTGTGFDR